MSEAPFQRLAVLGLGLLGGSVAVAARERGLAREVIGAGRRQAPLERALAAGLVDGIGSPAEAVVGADFVVLATPVGTMARVVADVAESLAPGTLVTDVGSVKAYVVDTLPGLLPAGVDFVGSHPMAGSHLRGPDHARADLFEGATCVVTPRAGQEGAPIERVEAFWRAVGARVERREPAVHDEEVAWVSHLPHLVAFAFADALQTAPSRVGALAGGGFRDFTRIAQSDAELWGEILQLNGKALSGPLNRFSESLARYARALEEGDLESLERMLSQARSRLEEVASHAGRVAGNDPEERAPKVSAKARSGGN
ncbi:MAG: prephenate dehydrogenase/arogenate dehydrogenase family protein [Deltaproteobacteria bacterium]|jgi:cyclohexadieny/prephenate dehydrogenase|nr:prephenate dehydrogenase/arogenate dehydrogenase family protein [Deltaproteobacteria bacterium]MBW2500653.1 prephenate dehydrogenase/arogenate dehydrogenase family protein [Deltaproteobacteria bacterium]